MGTRVVACIPTIGMSPHLGGLCQSLAGEQIETRLYVNSGEVPELVRQASADHKGWICHRPEWTIYQEWNDAAEWACELDAFLLVLNDDIIIAPQFGFWLGEALDRYPEYGLISANPARPTPVSEPGGVVVPTGFRQGDRRAFANWAFAARPMAYHMVGGFEVWYGDDHLIRQVEDANWYVGHLTSVGVYHDTSTTTRQLPWTNEAVARDHARWTT